MQTDDRVRPGSDTHIRFHLLCGHFKVKVLIFQPRFGRNATSKTTQEYNTCKIYTLFFPPMGYKTLLKYLD